MKLAKYICLCTALSSGLSSCQSDLMDLNPYDKISSESMWGSENLADQGVNAIYNVLRSGNVAYEIYKFDAYGVTTDARDAINLLRGTITSGDGLFSGYWKQHYEGIHRANDAILNLAEHAPLSNEKKGRLIAESKFLRAFFYYKMNMTFKGVPLYLEPIELEECIRGRETEAKIWEVVINDLTDCINEPNLPNRYVKGDPSFGRISKSTAYALRGKVYMWTKEWAKAEADFVKVGALGHKLFDGGYKQLFKEANEQSEEAIFSVQCIGLSGLGNDISFKYGSRVTFGSCWNSYFPNVDFVDSYECVDGKEFDWNDVIPGYNEMDPAARSAYFLRDGMTDAEKSKMEKDQKADLSKYLDKGNEARIQKAFENRDPRLTATVITPYSKYAGAISATSYTYTLRWPYRGYDTAEPFDLKTDSNNRFYYLYRKFVAEGASEIPSRSYSPIDIPIIRYADVLLSLAEAYNEQGKTAEAIQCVNLVRTRAGIASLNSNEHTAVAGTEDLRERIRNERRWEFNGEGVNYFDELRWKSWDDAKFKDNAGLKQIWGQIQYDYSLGGDHYYRWPVPRAEKEMNDNLEQSAGWND